MLLVKLAKENLTLHNKRSRRYHSIECDRTGEPKKAYCAENAGTLAENSNSSEGNVLVCTDFNRTNVTPFLGFFQQFLGWCLKLWLVNIQLHFITSHKIVLCCLSC